MTIDPLDILDDSCDILTNTPKFCHGNPGDTFTYTRHSLIHSHLEIPSINFHMGPSNNTKLMAHYIWKSSLLLAHLIDTRHIILSGLKVLEMGAGIGVPGFIAAFNGPSRVYITDYPDSCILDTLGRNKSEVERLFSVSNVEVCGYLWGSRESVGGGGFDVILLADTFWLEDFHGDLLDSFFMLLSSEGVVHLTCCNHAATETVGSGDTGIREEVEVVSVDQLRGDLDLTATSRKFLEMTLTAGLRVVRAKTVEISNQFPEHSQLVAYYKLFRK